jgi:hypothetical protein
MPCTSCVCDSVDQHVASDLCPCDIRRPHRLQTLDCSAATNFSLSLAFLIAVHIILPQPFISVILTCYNYRHDICTPVAHHKHVLCHRQYNAERA